MNREDLVSRISEKMGNQKYLVRDFIKAYEECVSEALQENEQVHLHGFITYRINQKPAKVYKNPKTGKVMNLEPTKKIKVTVSNALNRLIK